MLHTTSWHGKLKSFRALFGPPHRIGVRNRASAAAFISVNVWINWRLGVVDIKFLLGNDVERYVGNTHAVPWSVGRARVAGDVGFHKSRPRLLPTPLAGLYSASAARPLCFPGSYILCIQGVGSVGIAIRSLISHDFLRQGPGRGFQV